MGIRKIEEHVHILCDNIVNQHQSCGYSDSPFAKIHYFYTAGSRNELEGVGAVATRKLYPRKRHVFLIEKYIVDARQDEKHVPDLLESMLESGLVKEELRQKLIKISQCRSQIPKFKVSTFWIPEIQVFRAAGQCQPSHQYVLSNNEPINPNNRHQNPNKSKK